MHKISEQKTKGLEGVVISARWAGYWWQPSIALSEQDPANPQKLAKMRANMIASFDSTLSMLESIGVRVAVLLPTPELNYFAPQCTWLNKGSRCNVPRKTMDTYLAGVTADLEKVVKRHPNARLIPLMDFFCDAQTCFAMRDGKVLYVDSDHITATTARDLGRYLRPELTWLLGKSEAASRGQQ
jgi:hypothetical protein